MIAVVALLGYAAGLLTLGARALARASWPERSPRLGIAAWFALAGTGVVSVVLGGLALTVPTARVSGELAGLLHDCDIALRAQYAHPGGAVAAAAGAAGALAVIIRTSWCAARALTRAALGRRRHRTGLALAGRPDPRLGVTVVDHAEPAAWCLPGAGGQVVLTRGAINTLDRSQLAAVLAHERAHQRGRHHLLVSLAGSLAAAFPWVPGFGLACRQIARLAEVLADDAATRTAPRLTVAAALLALSAPAPATALGAGGSATAARIRRLIAAPPPLSRAGTAGAMMTVAAMLALPLVLLAGPALIDAGQDCLHMAMSAPAPPHLCPLPR